jgi:ABC-type bacteriocin/lantibiotic exporter with double-glycine peptidase domain
VRPLVEMIPQRHEADCGVTVLAMFLGISYEDALLAVGQDAPQVLRAGLWLKELQRASAKLGVPLKVKRRWDAEDADGIAQIRLPGRFNHFVLARGGLVFNTNFSVWEWDDYLKARRATPGVLLVREDE